ncbi:unnamed protein product, partial [Urochloa humidicola]
PVFPTTRRRRRQGARRVGGAVVAGATCARSAGACRAAPAPRGGGRGASSAAMAAAQLMHATPVAAPSLACAAGVAAADLVQYAAGVSDSSMAGSLPQLRAARFGPGLLAHGGAPARIIASILGDCLHSHPTTLQCSTPPPDKKGYGEKVKL